MKYIELVTSQLETTCNSKRKLGSFAERFVEHFLEQNYGYKAICRNKRTFINEIDLIMFDPSENSYIFIEVRSRKVAFFTKSDEICFEKVFPSKKIYKLRTVAEFYMDRRNINTRIDALYVEICNKAYLCPTLTRARLYYFKRFEKNL